MYKGDLLRKERVFFIFVSIFVISFSVGAYNPLVPIYAQIFGATYTDQGIIGAAYALPYIIFPILVGFMSDRFDRRYFYLLGVTLTAISAILFILASDLVHIVLVRIFGGLAFAFLWPTVEAILVDFSTNRERMKVMGQFSFSWAIGFLLGPPIGGFILEKTSFPTLFTFCFIVGLIAVLLAICGLTYKKPSINTKALNNNDFNHKFRLLNKNLLSIYVVVITYSMVFGVIFSIFPVYASDFGITSFQLGILFAFFGVMRAIMFLFSEKISNIGIRRALVIGLTIQALGLFLAANFIGIGYFAIFLTLVGIAMGIFSPLTLSTASKLASRSKIGITLGSVEALFGFGDTIGPFYGGMIAETFGASIPYFSLAFISLLAIIPVTIIRFKNQP